jgi:hypothetical protein
MSGTATTVADDRVVTHAVAEDAKRRSIAIPRVAPLAVATQPTAADRFITDFQRLQAAHSDLLAKYSPSWPKGHAPGDRAQREHAPAELWITSPAGSSYSELLQQPCACQRPQLASQRFGRRDQQVAQLAETGTLGVDCTFPRCHHRLQRLAFTARPAASPAAPA